MKMMIRTSHLVCFFVLYIWGAGKDALIILKTGPGTHLNQKEWVSGGIRSWLSSFMHPAWGLFGGHLFKLHIPFVQSGTLQVARDKCSMWFAHDCTQATWAYVLETVRAAVRRLSKISNCAFLCDYDDDDDDDDEYIIIICLASCKFCPGCLLLKPTPNLI